VNIVFRWPSQYELEKSRRERTLVTVQATIAEYNPDDQDEEGAMHQILILRVTEVVEASNGAAVTVGDLLFLAVRYGDPSGLSHPIPGLATGNPIEVRGAYVTPEDAYPQPDGRLLGVLHFTHRPLGWIKYQGETYR
jgi:hypothetical protein